MSLIIFVGGGGGMVEFGRAGCADLVDLVPLRKVVAVRPWTLPSRVRVLTLLPLGWPRFWSWDTENVMVWYAVYDKCPWLFGGSLISLLVWHCYWKCLTTQLIIRRNLLQCPLLWAMVLLFWWVSNLETAKPSRHFANKTWFCECRGFFFTVPIRMQTCPENAPCYSMLFMSPLNGVKQTPS